MSQVIIRHKVNSYEEWKRAFDGFAEFRKSSGERSHRIFHQADDPNDLTLIFEWDSQSNAETFLASEELKSKMQEAGVNEVPNIQFLIDLAKGSF